MMRAVRPLAVALAAVVGAFACDRSPTGLPAEQSALFESSSSSQTAPTKSVSCAPSAGESMAQLVRREGGATRVGPHCFTPNSTLRAPSFDRESSDQRRGNYAVAW